MVVGEAGQVTPRWKSTCTQRQTGHKREGGNKWREEKKGGGRAEILTSRVQNTTKVQSLQQSFLRSKFCCNLWTFGCCQFQSLTQSQGLHSAFRYTQNSIRRRPRRMFWFHFYFLLCWKNLGLHLSLLSRSFSTAFLICYAGIIKITFSFVL